MKFTVKTIGAGRNILANDHFSAITYDCTSLTSLATDGVIKEGTIIPANDQTAVGVLLNDVYLNENKNGTVVVHGAIRVEKLPATPSATAITALKDILFLDYNAKPLQGKFSVTYNNNGGTGTATDASSPYAYGSTVTTKAYNVFTAPTGKTFHNWNTKADNTGTALDPTGTFIIKESTVLYAIWGEKFTVTYLANGATSGTVPVDTGTYGYNDTVTAKTNSGSLALTGKTFAGWNTKADGTGTDIAVSATFTIADDAVLYAKWN